MRNRIRFLIMGLATVLGFIRRGFFIPYRYAEGVPEAANRKPYGALEGLFRDRAGDFLDLLSSLAGYAVELEAMGKEPAPAPRWHQDWFPRMDGAVAYDMVRRLAPKRIVEVGSGHSTRFLARAVADGGLETEITAIDPAPRAHIASLGVRVVPEIVQSAGMETFSILASGDILSVDSSHILMPGSDVDILFNTVLPTLPSGVVVHIHDIFLPDDYPQEWEWRAYNEQLAVATLLQGEGFEILWSSRYVVTRMADALEGTVIERLELADGAYESSLWLKKR